MTSINRISSDYRRALRGFASTVCIVSARTAAGNCGITVTAVSSVSMDPPSLLVAVNESSSMHARLLEASHFCINILGAEQVQHSANFGSPLSMEERFEIGDWRLSADDVPYLCEAQANIFCKKADSPKFGTHSLFIGCVYQLAIGDEIAPLMYLNGKYITPSKLVEVAPSRKTAWAAT
ncbi:flavin reductase family protein [Hydrogenophaga sp. OTU3427]|uniref:flavin reductase family protein n=1 Tax=Hydrogenophaga sp. OTU3427 TaxID=3043856 RepID=UPI00313BC8D0